MKQLLPFGRAGAYAVLATLIGCDSGDSGSPAADAETSPLTAQSPSDVPSLHHVMLNSVDPDVAIDWYLSVWPSAERTEIAGMPAVAAEMYLLFNEVDQPAAGAFRPGLGRPEDQSALWHIGAFANTTDMDASLGAVGVPHLPLRISPDDEVGVWRSGLVPYAGIRTVEQIAGAEPADPRDGGFSYVLAPDGVLFELAGGPGTRPSMSHVHLFHEQPRCAANWYVERLGMSLPPARNPDGSAAPSQPFEPCEAEIGEGGWPSLERAGTIRDPRGTFVHGSGSISFYPRQCHHGRCGEDRPLAATRGQVLDHVAFTVGDVDAWHAWLLGADVEVVEAPHPFGDSGAFMIEGPDGLAIELVEAEGAPPVRVVP